MDVVANFRLSARSKDQTIWNSDRPKNSPFIGFNCSSKQLHAVHRGLCQLRSERAKHAVHLQRFDGGQIETCWNQYGHDKFEDLWCSIPRRYCTCTFPDMSGIAFHLPSVESACNGSHRDANHTGTTTWVFGFGAICIALEHALFVGDKGLNDGNHPNTHLDILAWQAVFILLRCEQKVATSFASLHRQTL